MDAFTLGVKVEAAKRYVARRGWDGALIVRGFLDQLTRSISAGTPLAAIKDQVIQMRGSAEFSGTGSRHEVWAWFDRWSFELADYLSTDEELLTIRELSARFHADLEAAHEAQTVSP